MSFVANLVLLVGLVCVMFMPIYIGNGLSEHSGARMLLGLGFGVVGAAILFALSRMAGRADKGADSAAH